ncbi:LacI family DNA-binding transcriptional regulator [Plantibacter sp. CFBP 8775]|uniref:LacI family DNA-binding transcriptional regulator n=1 Tax=Plantibacter sp. CFBP 8775 TaxID=2774038 RepID=UPI0017874A0B|nr:LacI family DNA-binding transcriptional regulator [Plantibacter sp. CFBP 8775]MBD8104592.1 LacI family DNA-binding transcriptional regulator [Plantibacter sp. CFBP 8775]
MAKHDIGFAAVARLAGVSNATVSNTLNRPEIVAPATRERVLAAIEELDFVPNRAAATLRQGTNRLIGLVIPDIANPFYSAIARGVTEAAAELGYTVALCVSHDDPDLELRHFEMLAEHRAAGALVAPLTADASRLAQLRRVGSRLVLMDRTAPEGTGCSVAIDDVHGGELAVAHLLGRPAQASDGSIVLVNGDLAIPQCADRREGARNAFIAAGLDPDDLREVTVDEMTVDAGRIAGRRIAARTPRPTGVFCTNDQLALGVIRGLDDGGLTVPDEVSVVGYGDLALAADGRVPLTTVEQPKDELGRVAVEILLAELGADRAAHEHVTRTLEPHLVVRESAPLPA